MSRTRNARRVALKKDLPPAEEKELNLAVEAIDCDWRFQRNDEELSLDEIRQAFDEVAERWAARIRAEVDPKLAIPTL